jgi:hypothetical protein
MRRGKNLKLWIIALVVGAFVLIDLAPAFVSAQDTMQLAQQERPRKRRTLMDMLFGEPEVIGVVPQQVQEAPKKKRVPQAALPPAKPPVEKAIGATRVAIFGDSLAADLGKAMERFYAEDPNLSVLNMGVGSSGFVREDFFNWDKTIEEQIAANTFDVAVMIIGINDKQSITQDGNSYKALTDEWNVVYTNRVNAVLAKLRGAKKPVIWIGLPPMEQQSFSAAMSQVTAIQRLASFSGGVEFLDVYERFLDENGKYSAYGPDISGKEVQIRKSDGIHFSAAGSDKLAFYVSQSLKTFYRGGGIGVDIADPLIGTDAQTMLRPPYQGLGQMRLFETAGAVTSLSRSPARATGLLTATGTPPAGRGFDLEALMQAPVGRVDAFGVGHEPETDEELNPGAR